MRLGIYCLVYSPFPGATGEELLGIAGHGVNIDHKAKNQKRKQAGNEPASGGGTWQSRDGNLRPATHRAEEAPWNNATVNGVVSGAGIIFGSSTYAWVVALSYKFQ